jgi:hypothetical protein
VRSAHQDAPLAETLRTHRSRSRAQCRTADSTEPRARAQGHARAAANWGSGGRNAPSVARGTESIAHVVRPQDPRPGVGSGQPPWAGWPRRHSGRPGAGAGLGAAHRAGVGGGRPTGSTPELAVPRAGPSAHGTCPSRADRKVVLAHLSREQSRTPALPHIGLAAGEPVNPMAGRPDPRRAPNPNSAFLTLFPRDE